MSLRTTSAAKMVGLSTDRASVLDNHGIITSHFEHARDPLISKQHYDLVSDQKAMQARQARGSILTRDDARLPMYKASPSFSHQAANTQTPRISGAKAFSAAAEHPAPQAEQSYGSDMVKEDAPKPEYRPPEEMARAQNAKTHFEKMAQDRQKADSRNEAAIEAFRRTGRYTPEEHDHEGEYDRSDGYDR